MINKIKYGSIVVLILCSIVVGWLYIDGWRVCQLGCTTETTVTMDDVTTYSNGSIYISYTGGTIHTPVYNRVPRYSLVHKEAKTVLGYRDIIQRVLWYLMYYKLTLVTLVLIALAVLRIIKIFDNLDDEIKN